MVFWRKHAPNDQSPLLRCSFCNKTQDDVQKLIAGPNVHICDECVDVCNDILLDDRLRASAPDVPLTERSPSATGSTVVKCVLCTMTTSVDAGLFIEHQRIQGILCNECEGAIDEAIQKKADG